MTCEGEEGRSLKVGDFGDELEITLECKKTDDNPLGIQSLAGVESVTLRLHKQGTDEPSVDRAMVVDADPTTGIARYVWQADDTAEELTYEIEVIVVFSGSTKEVTWPEDLDRPTIPVYPRLPAPAAP